VLYIWLECTLRPTDHAARTGGHPRCSAVKYTKQCAVQGLQPTHDFRQQRRARVFVKIRSAHCARPFRQLQVYWTLPRIASVTKRLLLLRTMARGKYKGPKRGSGQKNRDRSGEEEEAFKQAGATAANGAATRLLSYTLDGRLMTGMGMVRHM
jgi:hypothetical protein